MATRHFEQEEQEFQDFCAAHGCKRTRQRRAIYLYLRENYTHPTVNQVWEAVRQEIPSITRESVFRILSEMVDYGQLNRMDKIVNARFDSRISEHGHVICRRCGKVADFDLPSPLPPIPDIPGFTGLHREYRLCGLCAACAEEERKEWALRQQTEQAPSPQAAQEGISSLEAQ
ncbi:MAG: Fur family transcriptional regulator [Oligosphaeraceae bacterium]